MAALIASAGRANASAAPGSHSDSRAGAIAPGTSPLLDRSFGDHGRVVVRLSYPPEQGLDAELLDDDKPGFVVAGGRYVFRFRPDGSLDPDFGEGGRLRIGPPSAGLDFEPVSLLSESGGRLTVGGTTGSYDGEILTQAWPTVRRYGSDGQPDPAFAEDGVFMSDLGFPPLEPYTPVESSDYEPPPETFGHPHVLLERLESDGRGGYRLEGEGVLTETHCLTAVDPRTYEPFTAHLTAGGELDASFGEGGVQKGPVVNLGCGVIRQGPEDLYPSLAFIGTPRHARAIASASGVDAEGRTTLLVSTYKKKPDGKSVNRDYLVRLDRRGRFDRGFGDGGKMRFTTPLIPRWVTDFSAIHVAADGSVLIVGTQRKWTRGHGPATGRYILAEADSHGHLLRGPGARIFSTIGFPEGVSPNHPTVLGVGRGRVLLWSRLGGFDYDNRGFVLARVTP